jgi:hypothetical protein
MVRTVLRGPRGLRPFVRRKVENIWGSEFGAEWRVSGASFHFFVLSSRLSCFSVEYRVACNCGADLP